MDEKTLASLIDAYGFAQPVTLHPLQGGTNNASYYLASRGQVFVLKRYQTYAHASTLAYEHRLLGWLGNQKLSFAVPAPLRTSVGETLVRAAGECFALFSWLPGELPKPTLIQAEAYGAGLGELHATLAGFPHDPRPGVFPSGALDVVHPHVPEPSRLASRFPQLAEEAGASEALVWWEHEVAELQSFIAGPYRALPWQVIHGDVAFVNSLFLGDRLVALLDFEFALPDARALDLAAALRSLLRRREAAVFSALAGALISGYQRWNTLTTEELTALPFLIRLNSAVSTIWWFGRGIATGDAHSALARLFRAQQLACEVAQAADTFQCLFSS